jgi:hypothetical protein
MLNMSYFYGVLEDVYEDSYCELCYSRVLKRSCQHFGSDATW